MSGGTGTKLFHFPVFFCVFFHRLLTRRMEGRKRMKLKETDARGRKGGRGEEARCKLVGAAEGAGAIYFANTSGGPSSESNSRRGDSRSASFFRLIFHFLHFLLQHLQIDRVPRAVVHGNGNTRRERLCRRWSENDYWYLGRETSWLKNYFGKFLVLCFADEYFFIRRRILVSLQQKMYRRIQSGFSVFILWQ